MAKLVVVRNYLHRHADLNDVTEIKRKGQLYSIEQPIHWVEDEKELAREFSLFLLEAERKNQLFAMNSFLPLKKNLHLLNKLVQSKLDCYFYDFEHADKTSLPAIEALLSQTALEKGQKIKVRLQKRKDEGKFVGNPKLGKENDPAAAGRKLIAWGSPENRKAIVEILTYKAQDPNMSFNQIAEELNQRGFKTRRGEKFYARTVIRLLESRKELDERFKIKEGLDKQFIPKDNRALRMAYGDNAPTLNELPVEGIENGANFEEAISFSIGAKIKSLIHVLIRESKDVAPIVDEKFAPDQLLATISLKDYPFLPGSYFLSIRVEGYPLFLRHIYVYKSYKEAISVP